MPQLPLDGRRVLCFVGHEYEDLELWYPKLRLEEAGAHVTVAGLEEGVTYHGKHGLSLRLHGLDEGVNDAAFDRAIVIHGADYVRESIVPQLGRLGRSLGCPALSQEAAPRIIDLIKGGTVVYAGRS